jgi:hypothetical protein
MGELLDFGLATNRMTRKQVDEILSYLNKR